ncbi:MAG: hypothetical protein AB1503_12105 [Bacillota bacterium]
MRAISSAVNLPVVPLPRAARTAEREAAPELTAATAHAPITIFPVNGAPLRSR